MIICEPLGGLGNQLFQYAAAYALAKKHGVELRIDTNRFNSYKAWPYMLHRMRVPQDMATPDEMGGLLPAGHFLSRGFLRRLLPGPARHLYAEPHFHYDPAFEQLGPKTFLRGYFQSERYFASAAEDLRALFLPQATAPANVLVYQKAIESIDCAVSLHVRRGDYITNQAALTTHGLMQLAYYERAVKLMTALMGKQPHFFIFSDDPDWVEQNMTFCPQRTIVRGNDEVAEFDMWLMSKCQHHIIANSTFSWWGAWLNARPGRQVIAPRRWFNYDELIGKNIRDIYPDDWILL